MRRFSTLQTLSKQLQISTNHFYILSKNERIKALLGAKKTMSPNKSTVDFLLNLSKNITVNSTDSFGNVEFYLS